MPPAAPPPVRLGIIGPGSMGRAHAHIVASGKAPGLSLAALCGRSRHAPTDFPDLPWFDSPAELLASGLCDAVLIATPHLDHVPTGIAALQAGLHVLVEKPLAAEKADCLRLLETPRRPGQVFAAMFNQRTDPAYLQIRTWLRSGALGEIRRIQWTITDWFRTDVYYQSSSWRGTWAGEGGGVLLNQCPHQLDLWQWLFGMPRQVRAFCHYGRHHPIEVEDCASAHFESDAGWHGSFLTTTGEAPGTNRLEIAATRGRVVLENRQLRWTETLTDTDAFLRQAAGGFEKPQTREQVLTFEDHGPQHAGILANFADAIRHGAELIAPAEEGLHSLELANAMLLSSHLGQTLTLPLDPAAYRDFLRQRIAARPAPSPLA
jgi:predicted dehydrogenase